MSYTILAPPNLGARGRLPPSDPPSYATAEVSGTIPAIKCVDNSTES